MKNIPETENSPMLRTDFSDEAAWKALCAAIGKPYGQYKFQANVEFVSDPAFDGVTPEEALKLIKKGYNHSFIFLVDRLALTQAEHPVLVMDLYAEPGRTFRVIPSEMWGVENNLSIANMDFADFAEAVDGDGIFRDFREK